MFRNYVLYVVGVALIGAGMLLAGQQRDLSLLSDQELGSFRVGCGQKCKTPEPDCVDINCYAVDSTHCRAVDDYWFIENNVCEPNPGTVCARTDLADCNDIIFCNRHPLFTCTYDLECGIHQNCSTTTVKGYDDCTTGY